MSEINLALAPQLHQRLVTLAEQKGVSPSTYLSGLLSELLRLPDPADWLTRLGKVARIECREILDAAERLVPSEEAIPAYLPLALVATSGSTDETSAAISRHASERPDQDSWAIFLELISCYYLDVCAQDATQPKTGEIATLETCLAERYFYCFPFADFRQGLLVNHSLNEETRKSA